MPTMNQKECARAVVRMMLLCDRLHRALNEDVYRNGDQYLWDPSDIDWAFRKEYGEDVSAPISSHEVVKEIFQEFNRAWPIGIRAYYQKQIEFYDKCLANRKAAEEGDK